MTPLQQYAVLLGMIVATIGLVFALSRIARTVRRTESDPNREMPFTAGRPDPKPAWVRYHVRYYGFALLFLAFDMEMAFMYPWAVVFRQLGWTGFTAMAIFLGVAVIGLIYEWRKGALEWE